MYGRTAEQTQRCEFEQPVLQNIEVTAS